MWSMPIILPKALEFLMLKTVIGFLLTDMIRAAPQKKMKTFLSEVPLTLPLPYTILIQIHYIFLNLIHNYSYSCVTFWVSVSSLFMEDKNRPGRKKV